MLAFLRRHQRILFAVITVVIVISFSFFGTYSAFVGNPIKDKVAFVAVDGSRVYQSEVRDLAAFISTDAVDERIFMQPYAGNGLNDGVLANDVFANGLAPIIAKPFKDHLVNDFSSRMNREKRFTPYRHPTAPYINAELVWNYFAPNIKKNFDLLLSSSNPLSDTALKARVDLYLAEREFPSTYLKQLVRYQESQHQAIAQDDQLLSRDLALFGYHNVQDWFGQEYIELVAKYIINVAKYAEKQGLKISTDEALGSLFANANTVVTEGKLNQYYGVINPNEYFQTTVHRLGMDQGRAAVAWRWVLLFRRYINEQKNSVLIDNLAFRDFYNHRNEFVDVELFTLPPELQLRTVDDVEKFDLYVRAVTDQKKVPGDRIFFPFEAVLTAADVKKLYPDLVTRNFRLRFTSVDRQDIEGKIGLKKTWQWQVVDANWAKIKEQFPELIKIQADTEDERHQALDNIDVKTRLKIDDFSRKVIVDQHPEWIEEALSRAEPKEEDVMLRERGGHFPFAGIKDRQSFFAILDTAPLHETSKELQAFTQDKIHYYKISILNRGEEEVLSYKDALSDGTLDQMLNTILDLTYQRVRKEKPSKYLSENGEWKPLSAVHEEIASIYFEESFSSLDKEVDTIKKELPHLTAWEDQTHAVR